MSAIPCNTMRHRGVVKTPVLSRIQEVVVLEKLRRDTPLPGWAYDDHEDAFDQPNVWDAMMEKVI